MTKTFVYRLKNTKTGQYLKNIQLPNTMSGYVHSHLSMTDASDAAIFVSADLVAKIYTRVDAARYYLETRKALDAEYSVGASVLGNTPVNKLEEIIKFFDNLELEVSELAPPKPKDLKKTKKIANAVIKDIRAKQALATEISRITETSSNNDYIFDGFQTWERNKLPDVDFILKLRKQRTELGITPLTLINELGIKYINLDSEKPNVTKGLLIGVSYADMQLIKISQIANIDNSVAIKDILQLQEELKKKFNTDL